MTSNRFRDRLETVDLQGLFVWFASPFASRARSVLEVGSSISGGGTRRRVKMAVMGAGAVVMPTRCDLPIRNADVRTLDREDTAYQPGAVGYANTGAGRTNDSCWPHQSRHGGPLGSGCEYRRTPSAVGERRPQDAVVQRPR